MAQEYDPFNVWHEIDNMNKKQQEEYIRNVHENYRNDKIPVKPNKKRKASEANTTEANTTEEERRLLATKGMLFYAYECRYIV